MKKYLIGITFLVLFLFGCTDPNQGNNTTGSKDAELKLVSITIAGKQIAKDKLAATDWPIIDVKMTQDKLTSDDIKAEFDYGAFKNKPLAVTVDKEQLVAGNNTITLSVPEKKNEHKGWTHKVTIHKPSKDVHFKFVSFKVKVSATPEKWEFAKEVNGKWTVEVPNSMKSIASLDDIKAYFEWDDMEAPKPRELAFTVEGGVPITLAEPAQNKEIKLTVEREASGKYPEWNGSIFITRNGGMDKIKKIKLQSAIFAKQEFTDFTQNEWNAGETHAPSVNVFFFKDAAADQEDKDLLAHITTVPELKKTGNLKTWELKDIQNTLEVKFDGNTILTISLKRGAVEIGKVLAYETLDAPIKEDPEEGQTYPTKASNVSFSVLPKYGYKYKKMTVQVGSNQAVELKKAAPTSGYNTQTPIALVDGNNQVILTAVDESEKAEFTFTLRFIIKKKVQGATIDPKVKIKKLWIGNGTERSFTKKTYYMNKDDANKFLATVDSTDPRKFTATVDKLYNKNSVPVGLIVEGDDNAKTAEISDSSLKPTDPKGVADGTAVFQSFAVYKNLPKEENKDDVRIYEFKLKNGDAEETYKVIITFAKEVKFKMSYTKPSNGMIKVEYDGKEVDMTNPIDIDASEFSKKYTITLIADAGKTAKKLLINEKVLTKVTQVKVGNEDRSAIQATISAKLRYEDILLTGECGD